MESSLEVLSRAATMIQNNNSEYKTKSCFNVQPSLFIYKFTHIAVCIISGIYNTLSVKYEIYSKDTHYFARYMVERQT